MQVLVTGSKGFIGKNLIYRLKENKEYVYLLPVADRKLMKQIQESFSKLNLPVIIKEEAMQDFLSISDISIVTSGTATLESAILECSPIIC